MKSIFKIFFFVLICATINLVFVTCKKDKNEGSHCGNLEDNYPDTYLVNHFLFDSASYWIYHDSIQNVNDSIFNNGPHFTKIEGTSGPAGPGQGTCPYSYIIGANSNTNTSEQYLWRIKDNSLIAYQTSTTGYFSVAVSNGNGLITNNNVVYFPTCNIGGITYTDVYRCFYVNHGGPGVVPDSICKYVKPDVGIVRSELFFSGQKKVYNLISYHIQ
ncbi:MAG: hypothetical protein IAF38_05460 [Bacteroidia bacterium]|nr:hypothetical protein [Bacteroidia bacterium]